MEAVSRLRRHRLQCILLKNDFAAGFCSSFIEVPFSDLTTAITEYHSAVLRSGYKNLLRRNRDPASWKKKILLLLPAGRQGGTAIKYRRTQSFLNKKPGRDLQSFPANET